SIAAFAQRPAASASKPVVTRPSRSIAPHTRGSARRPVASGVYLLLFFFGTLAPDLRASLRPMAIACFLLVTFLPEPLRSVPCLRSCMVFLTFDCAVV